MTENTLIEPPDPVAEKTVIEPPDPVTGKTVIKAPESLTNRVHTCWINPNLQPGTASLPLPPAVPQARAPLPAKTSTQQ